MGMLTSARVDIAAPATDVWVWLVEPARLTRWLGGTGAMPEDSSVLQPGWSTTIDAPPVGRVTLEIQEYVPPVRLRYRSVYAGGDAITTCTLTEGEGFTTLLLEGDTDWARPEGAWQGELDAALGDRAEEAMQHSLDASLQKLKALIEAGA